jgi:hypothetical protein
MKGRILLTGTAGQIGDVLRSVLAREALGLISADVAPLTPIAATSHCLTQPNVPSTAHRLRGHDQLGSAMALHCLVQPSRGRLN